MNLRFWSCLGFVSAEIRQENCTRHTKTEGRHQNKSTLNLRWWFSEEINDFSVKKTLMSSENINSLNYVVNECWHVLKSVLWTQRSFISSATRFIGAFILVPQTGNRNLSSQLYLWGGVSANTHQNTSRTGETRGQEQNWGSNCSRHHEDQLVGHAAFILKCKLHKSAHVFNFNVFFLYFLWHYFAFKMILYKVMIWCRI